MKQTVYKAFNIESGEGLSVLLLILQSFFLGIFYGSFDIAASALFLDAFPPSMLPKAFVISGVAGIILTSIYTRLQSKISFSKLALINLITITIITILLRLGYNYTASKWLPFIILVMMGPLNIIAILGFWGVAGRMFSLRQGKRLFGMIDSGQVFGIIVSCYAIPVILLLSFSTQNLLVVCSGSILLALFVQILITRKYSLKDSDLSNDSEFSKKKQSFFGIFKNKFIVYMSIFVVLSMISAFFIYYSFLSVTTTKYPNSKDLAKFLGVFTGTLMIFSFIFKTFVYSKIMQTYNLKISLLILPTLLIALSLLAVVTGTVFGYTAETSGFLLFFLLISLSRLFSRSLKESIEAPSFKILYLSLNKNIRYDIQAKIDGIVNEFAALFSGIVLAVLGILVFIKPIHYTYILIGILIIWFLVALKLYKEYQHALIKSLENAPKEKNSTSNIQNFKSLESEIHENTITFLKISEITEPLNFETNLLNYLDHKSPDVRNYILTKIADLSLYRAIDKLEGFIENEKNTNNKNTATELLLNLKKKSNINLSKEYILELIKSKYPEKREYAVTLISNSQNEAYQPYLIPLLRDIDIRVRHATIIACSKVKNPETIPLLIEYLSDPVFRNHAAEALITFGQDALDILELSFYKSDLDTKIQIKIIQIFGIIGGEKAVAHLINKLNFPVRDVVKKAIEALAYLKYQYVESHYIYIRQAIDLTISIVAWNLSAKDNIKEPEFGTWLKDALDTELKDNMELLYLLLSLVYDPKMILTAKDNIENGSSEGVGYALELLDLYIADDLKHILFPLFENTSTTEKIKRLQDFYPLEKLEIIELLYSIIRRDSNLVNKWTKACAIYSLLNFRNIPVQNDLLAHLFNPDKLLFETTGYVVHQLDSKAYNSCCNRIDAKLRNELDYILILSTEKKTHILVEKIIFLKSLPFFQNLHNLILADIAEALEEITLKDDTVVISKTIESDTPLIMIINGNISLSSDKYFIADYGNNELISETMIQYSDHPSICFKTTKETAVYSIKRKKLFELISNHKEIASTIIQISNSRITGRIEKNEAV